MSSPNGSAPESALPHDLAPELPAELEVAWRHALEEWDAEARHTAFIELCALRGRLADAGKLYRRVRETEPERALSAQRQIDRVIARAMATMDRQVRPAPNPTPRRLVLALALVVAGGMMASALYAAMSLASR